MKPKAKPDEKSAVKSAAKPKPTKKRTKKRAANPYAMPPARTGSPVDQFLGGLTYLTTWHYPRVRPSLVSVPSLRDSDTQKSAIRYRHDRLVEFHEAICELKDRAEIGASFTDGRDGQHLNYLSARLCLDRQDLEELDLLTHVACLSTRPLTPDQIRRADGLIGKLGDRSSGLPSHSASPVPTESADGAVAEEEPGSLRKSDRLVLVTMERFDGSVLLSVAMIKKEMDANTPLSSETIRLSVKRLRPLRLVERPQGPRKGARLTRAGRLLIPKIAD